MTSRAPLKWDPLVMTEVVEDSLLSQTQPQLDHMKKEKKRKKTILFRFSKPLPAKTGNTQ
jgi:hypothetical protein